MAIVITLNTDGPREPGYVLEVAEGLAEACRVLNHLTRDHAALEYPSEAHTLITSLEVMAQRMPQLLEQLGRWYAAEQAAGRLQVPATVLTGLGAASITAENFRQDLASAAAQTAWIARAAEDGSDDDR